MPLATRLLSRRDVEALLSLEECIDAVETALRAHAETPAPAGVLSLHVPGGGFHIKAAIQLGSSPLCVVKTNGNFFANEAQWNLPRIQGLIVVYDARHGYPLAVMDSTHITAVRTGAATAVAARHLALPGSHVVTIAGCGRQGRIQLRAVAAVCDIRRAWAYDVDAERATVFAHDMSAALGVPVKLVARLTEATRDSSIVVTCTPARTAILDVGDVGPGTFIAAVGADSDEKQEISPRLLAAATVVPDVLTQAAAFGDLHHAIVAGTMTAGDAHAELGAVLAGHAPGRSSPEEIIVFDSTGTALEDVAAAALVVARAEREGRGMLLDLLG